MGHAPLWVQLVGPAVIVLVAIGLIALLIYGIICAAKKAIEEERRRREALPRIASTWGLRYSEGDPLNLPAVYRDTSLCGQGEDRRASNVIFGRHQEGDLRFFDYEYTIVTTRRVYVEHGRGRGGHWETRTERTTYHKSACAVHVSYPLQRLRLRPESFLDKAAAFFGFDDVDLDHAEFNRRFCVVSDDKKFAYDILHQRAMEFLLARPDMEIEVMEDFFLLYRCAGSAATADEIEPLMQTAVGFCGLVPNFVRNP